MRKFLLSLGVLLGCLTMQAGTELHYGAGSDEPHRFSHNQANVWYEVAIEIPESLAKVYAAQNARLTSIGYYFGSGQNKECEVFITYDLDAEPFYTEEVRARVSRFNDNELTTPYVIEGRRFFIGYKYMATTQSCAPVCFDAETLGYNSCFDYFKSYRDGYEADAKWNHYGDSMGNACMQATIVADNLNVTDVFPKMLSLPKWAVPGEEFEIGMNVRNMGSEPIDNLEVVYKLGSDAEVPVQISLDTPIAVGEMGQVKFNALTNAEDYEMPLVVYIPKVNGNDNLSKDQKNNYTMVVNGNVFPRTAVFEKFTGTKCGWCPRGIAGFEMIKEQHPEAILIEVHNYNYPSDPMNCPSYMAWTSAYAAGAPHCVGNRAYSFDPSPDSMADVYEAIQGPAIAKVDVKAAFTDDTQQAVEVTATTEFGDALSDHGYALAFVVTEDKIGPYVQSNNYSGGGYGEMGGWEDKNVQTSMIYDDVAREIFDWEGEVGSIPATVEGHTPYEYTRTLTLDKMMNRDKETGLLKDPHDVNIIALIIDRNNGATIVNAGKCKIAGYEDPKPDSAVDGIETDNAPEEWFTLDGVRISAPTAPGIYLKRQGARVTKIAL